MHKVAVVILTSPEEDKYVLQRRKPDAGVYPGQLGFFGGHIESGEEPHETIKRELSEEIKDLGELELSHVASMSILPARTNSPEPVELHLYQATLEDLGIAATEGAEVEIHSLESALVQPDLLPTTRYVLENLSTLKR